MLMMTSLLLFFTSFHLSASATAQKTQIDCYHSFDAGTGVKFESTMSFDSSSLNLSSSQKATFEDRAPIEKKLEHLSKTSACYLVVDTAKECEFKERFDPKFGYELNFSCPSKNIKGQLYCDEDCFGAEGSVATFRCEKSNSTTNTVFSGCKAKTIDI